MQMCWDPICLVQNYNYPLSSPERWQKVSGSKNAPGGASTGSSSDLHPPRVAGDIFSDSIVERDCGNGTYAPAYCNLHHPDYMCIVNISCGN